MKVGLICMWRIGDNLTSIYRAFVRRGDEVEVLPAYPASSEGRARIEAFDGDLIFTWQGLGCPPELVAAKKMPKVIWNFDDPYRFICGRELGILLAHDVILSCDAGCVEKYRAMGKRSEWFPPAGTVVENLEYDPAYDADIAFVGQGYGLDEFPAALIDRSALMRAVHGRFPDRIVKVWSLNPNSWHGVPVSGGLTYEQCLNAYAQAQINLCSHGPFHDAYKYANDRLISQLSAGGFVLCDNVPGLSEWLTRGVVWYDSQEDCLDKIEYYWQRPEERKAIAAEGQAFIRANWTYDHFIEKMLSLVGLS